MYRVEIKLITPDEARKMLDRSAEVGFKNRPLNIAKVRAIANAIKSGKYNMTNDTICISVTGAVINGQHRLHAVIMAGMPILEVVKYGFTDEAFADMDITSKRTNNDILACMGVEKYRNTISAGLGQLVYFLKTNNVITSSPFRILNKTVVDMFPVYEKYSMLFNEGAAMYKNQTLIRIPCCIYIMAYVLFGSINTNTGKIFFEKFNSGDCLSADSPIFAMRKQTEQIINQKPMLRNPSVFALAILAWNAFVLGKPKKILRWDRKHFPAIAGFDKETFLEGVEVI